MLYTSYSSIVAPRSPRYKGFLPGVMSDSLRLALGLEDSELPSHVYRMRNFGYPPGYSIDPPKENSKGLVLYESMFESGVKCPAKFDICTLVFFM